MFAVGIYGGLASQMNQYCFYRALQRKYPNVDVKMAVAGDWRWQLEHNGYELDHVFGIKRNDIDIKTLKRLADFYPGWSLWGKFMNACWRVRNAVCSPKRSIIVPKDCGAFSSELWNVDPGEDKLFWGNWAEGYYADLADELRRDFAFRPSLDERNGAILKRIQAEDSISIHVRHGDYVKYHFPVLTLDYYRRAAEQVMAKVGNPTWYLFSDDPEFVAANFDFLQRKTIIRGNEGVKSYVDLLLMSECKHHILANSGFSHYAAWLKPRADKIVIRPDMKRDVV